MEKSINKDKCIEYAKDCRNRTEFSQKHKYAYDYARKNGFLDELFEDKRYGSKYSSEEERHKAKLEAEKRYYNSNKEKLNRQVSEWQSSHKEHLKEYRKKYYDENHERIREWHKNYYRNSNMNTKQKKYRHTKYGRALSLSYAYKGYDKDRFSDENTVSPQWIVDNIFSSECVYCGDDNWKHLGCDRIDNTKPHTSDNVVCSCGICNVERQILKMTPEQFKTYRKNNPLPKWNDKEDLE